MFRFINGRLSIAARMGVVGCLFAAPAVIALWLFVDQSWQNVVVAQSETAGAVFLNTIWPTLQNNGSAARGDDVVKTAVGFASGDAAGAFVKATARTDRIATGATLIGAIADGSQLTLDPDLDSFYTQDAVTVRLPAVLAAVDALKQAEAATDHDRRSEIIIAVNGLSTAADAAASSLGAAIKDNAEGRTKEALSAPAATLKSAIDTLIGQGKASEASTVEDSGLSPAVASVEARTDQVWSFAQAELVRLLNARINRIESKLTISLSLCILALVTASALAAAVAIGLARRISAQINTMEVLAANDTSVAIQNLDDRNETGRIAAALAIFKDGLIDRNRLQREAARLHEIAEAKLGVSEAAFRDAGQDQADVVETLSAALAKLAKGDLTVTVESVFPNYAKLRADFNSAVGSLREVVGGISSATSAIQNGANDIVGASDDLSRRTEQQAASLEETAAALDDITATIKRSADGSRKATALVTQTRSDTARSGEIMNEARAAVGEIEKSSGQISQIIGVIDEIAFQTNLLALNAGVEAARAGDAGRGFAVVAQEVRALAQRSAEAAKEIKSLISQSSGQVQRGVRLVGETGQALEVIVARVGEVDTLIGEIALASREQASSLSKVNTAVNQMDQITQQNAAMVKQATAAASTLKAEGVELTSLVSQFQIGDSASLRRRPETGLSPARNHAMRRAG